MGEISTRTLPMIAEEIRYLDNQAKRLVLGHAIEIGRRLMEAKELCQHGEWETYLREQVHYSTSSANNFIQVFKAYGATQQSLFGPMAVSEEVGNLPYTKALALLAVPEEERESFIKENPVEDMSVRELKQAIKERDEARALAEERQKKVAEAMHNEAQEGIRRTEAESRLQKSEKEREKLQKRVTELENRPIEVAIQRDEEAIRKAVEETEEKAAEELRKQKEAAEQLRAEWKKNLKELEDSRKALEAAEEKLKTSTAGELDAAKEELQKLREAADKAERKAALGEVMALFKQWQNIRNQLLGAVNGLDWENKDKMTKAMRAQIKMWSEAEG